MPRSGRAAHGAAHAYRVEDGAAADGVALVDEQPGGDVPAVVDPADRATVRTEFDVPPDTLVVTIVARLNPWKGHEALFKAFAVACACCAVSA